MPNTCTPNARSRHALMLPAVTAPLQCSTRQITGRGLHVLDDGLAWSLPYWTGAVTEDSGARQRWWVLRVLSAVVTTAHGCRHL